MCVSVGHAMGCQRLGIGLYSTASLKAALYAFKKDRIAWIRRLRYHQLTPQSHVLMLNSFRKYSEWLHFHLLLRQVCENNLLQPNLFINFPLIFFKTHTKDRCLGKSHQKKVERWLNWATFQKGSSRFVCRRYSSSLEPVLLRCFTTSTQFQPRGSSPL